MSVIIVVVFIISFGIDAIYRNIYHLKYELPQNIFILPEIKDKYDIVKLGNSHADDGIDFSHYEGKSLGLASVGQPFEYDLAYLKMHTRQIKKGAVILIDASPLSFSQKIVGVGDALQTNYYDGRISPFLIPNINVGDYIQSRILPFLRSGYLLRQKHMEEIQTRISNEERRPQDFVTQNNETDQKETLSSTIITKDYYNVQTIQEELDNPSSVPSNYLVDSMHFIVNKWYNTDGFGVQYFETNRKDLQKIIDYCFKMQWRPVLITVPVSQVLLNGLKSDYMQVYVYNNLLKTNLHGLDYFDFTKNIQLTNDSFLFANSDHLNGKGAAVFSYLLLRRLIDRGYLPEEADKYDYSPLWK